MAPEKSCTDNVNELRLSLIAARRRMRIAFAMEQEVEYAATGYLEAVSLYRRAVCAELHLDTDNERSAA